MAIGHYSGWSNSRRLNKYVYFHRLLAERQTQQLIDAKGEEKIVASHIFLSVHSVRGGLGFFFI